jgi:hypothetical protein
MFPHLESIELCGQLPSLLIKAACGHFISSDRLRELKIASHEAIELPKGFLPLVEVPLALGALETFTHHGEYSWAADVTDGVIPLVPVTCKKLILVGNTCEYVNDVLRALGSEWRGEGSGSLLEELDVVDDRCNSATFIVKNRNSNVNDDKDVGGNRVGFTAFRDEDVGTGMNIDMDTDIAIGHDLMFDDISILQYEDVEEFCRANPHLRRFTLPLVIIHPLDVCKIENELKFHCIGRRSYGGSDCAGLAYAPAEVEFIRLIWS